MGALCYLVTRLGCTVHFDHLVNGSIQVGITSKVGPVESDQLTAPIMPENLSFQHQDWLNVSIWNHLGLFRMNLQWLSCQHNASFWEQTGPPSKSDLLMGRGGLNVNSHKEWLLGDRIKLDEVFPNIPEAGHSVGEQLIPEASGLSWGKASLLYISGWFLRRILAALNPSTSIVSPPCRNPVFGSKQAFASQKKVTSPSCCSIQCKKIVWKKEKQGECYFIFLFVSSVRSSLHNLALFKHNKCSSIQHTKCT